jgi:hypothetical protein
MICSVILLLTSLFLFIFIFSLSTYCVRREEDDAVIPEIEIEKTYLEMHSKINLNSDFSSNPNSVKQNKIKIDFLKPHSNDGRKVDTNRS